MRSNSTQPDSNSTRIDMYHSLASHQYIEIVLITLFVAISLLGNTFIIIVKIAQSRLPSYSSLKKFRLSIKFVDLLSILLALCDILKGVSFLIIEHPWLSVSSFFCSSMQKVLLYVFSVSNFVTILLMAGRYRAICYPLKVATGKRSPSKIILFVVLALQATVFFGVPKLFMFHNPGNAELPSCIAADRSRSGLYMIIEISILVFSLTLSVACMSFFIVRIFRQLDRNKREKLSVKPRQQRQRNQRAVKILISIYIAYMTSYIPWVSLYLIGALNQPMYFSVVSHPSSVLLIGFIAGSFCNSFLTYLRYSSTFRSDLKRILCCKAVTTGPNSRISRLSSNGSSNSSRKTSKDKSTEMNKFPAN